MKNDCVFCRIIRKEMSAEIEDETDNFLVFKDANPKADIHLLIVPKKHILDVTEIDGNLWVEIKNIAVDLGRKKNLSGFRLTHNAGSAAKVKHMHVHFLGEVSAEREL